MDRKGIIAVILSLAVLVGWHFKTERELREWKKANPQAAAASASPAASAASTAQGVAPAATATALPPASLQTEGAESAPASPEPAAPEEKLAVASPSVEYTFTNLGGGIASAKLLKHEGERKGERMVINTLGDHPIGALLEQPGDSSNEAYTLSQNEGRVIAERVTPNGLAITKTFSLPQKENGVKEYAVELEIMFANRGTAPVEKAGYYLFAGAIGPIQSHELPTYTGLDWFRDGKAVFVDVHWFDAGHIPLVGYQTSAAKPVYHEMPGGVLWAGVKNQYFTSIISTVGEPGLGVWAMPIPVKIDSTELKGIEGALEMPGFKLNPGETATRKFTVYVGPKEYRLLKQLGQGEAEMMNFGIFKIISVFLLRGMNWLEHWLGSYALAIMVLTLIVRGALWPIQGKATTSMKRMQLLQPKMVELKEKFKDDPTKMNQELMKLYKDYGVNPFAGCLPMLIQIPIFFGFYSMLGTAVELRNSHFLWVSDLSLPDTVAHLFGYPINILPLLMAGTMVWQMQLTPKSGDPMQQRMFMFMPLIFVVFTYNFASALALYYTVQNILSIFQLYVTRNEAMPALVKKGTEKKPTGGGKKRKSL